MVRVQLPRNVPELVAQAKVDENAPKPAEAGK